MPIASLYKPGRALEVPFDESRLYGELASDFGELVLLLAEGHALLWHGRPGAALELTPGYWRGKRDYTLEMSQTPDNAMLHIYSYGPEPQQHNTLESTIHISPDNSCVLIAHMASGVLQLAGAVFYLPKEEMDLIEICVNKSRLSNRAI